MPKAKISAVAYVDPVVVVVVVIYPGAYLMA